MEVGRPGRAGAAVHRGNVLEIRRSGRGRALIQNLMPTEHIVLDLMPNVLTAQVNIHSYPAHIHLSRIIK
jgi:5-deoxy-D-glucuronate isomerase